MIKALCPSLAAEKSPTETTTLRLLLRIRLLELGLKSRISNLKSYISMTSFSHPPFWPSAISHLPLSAFRFVYPANSAKRLASRSHSGLSRASSS